MALWWSHTFFALVMKDVLGKTTLKVLLTYQESDTSGSANKNQSPLCLRSLCTQSSRPDVLRWCLHKVEYYDTTSFIVLGNSDRKESARNSEDLGLIPGSGRSPGEGNGNPLQYSCLENSMYREARQAAIHGVTKSGTWLSDLYTHIRLRKPFHMHDLNEFSW